LRTEMRSYLDRGYTVGKMKIGGASLDDDLRRIESVLSGSVLKLSCCGRPTGVLTQKLQCCMPSDFGSTTSSI
jgi:hypothetical protein